MNTLAITKIKIFQELYGKKLTKKIKFVFHKQIMDNYLTHKEESGKVINLLDYY